jgi:3-oxoacyl-[acyl-carrier-protein] synthase II
MSGRPHVVITGMGLISPLGSDLESFWDDMIMGRSGVRTLEQVPGELLGARFGAEAAEFSGKVEDFGELDKAQRRSVKKSLRVMCREIQMGVAAAQRALIHGNLGADIRDVDRTGVVYGSDYIMTVPTEFITSMRLCATAPGSKDNQFIYDDWASNGIPKVDPLWLLKFLPNMPASHIAIHNDLRGPNNSITMREASPNLAIAEAVMTIQRGQADVMIAGATGTRVHPLRSIHVSLQEQLAGNKQERECNSLSRPFDADRDGQVLGEGAAAIILETREHAEARGATVYGEILGFASSCTGQGDRETALANVMRQALTSSDLAKSDLGHIHAHGLSCIATDRSEAAAIQRVFGEDHPPVTAAKSQFGNLGCAGGMAELIVSVLAMQAGRLPAVQNFTTPDPVSPLMVNTSADCSPGKTFLNTSITPQGQASAIIAGI